MYSFLKMKKGKITEKNTHSLQVHFLKIPYTYFTRNYVELF